MAGPSTSVEPSSAVVFQLARRPSRAKRSSTFDPKVVVPATSCASTRPLLSMRIVSTSFGRSTCQRRTSSSFNRLCPAGVM